MKVKSNKEVHIRAFEPYRRTNNLKVILKPSFELEVEEVEGESVEEGEGDNNITSSKWYKDKNGDYYWSGGFEKITQTIFNSTSQTNIRTTQRTDSEHFFKTSPDEILTPVNLNTGLEIDNSIKDTRGVNVTIGIMDHPIPKLIKHFQNRISYIQNGGTIQDSHSLKLASIIGSNSEITDKGIIGIAPLSSILSIPIFINGDFQTGFYINAINKTIEKYKDSQVLLVVNLSLSIASKELISELEPHLVKLTDLFPVIASAGQDTELLSDKTLQWPARINNVISVGSISADFLRNNPQAHFNGDLDILMPDFSYPAHNLSPPPEFTRIREDSAATAAISAISSLIISKKGFLSKEQLLSSIDEISVGYNQLEGVFPFKPINPKK